MVTALALLGLVAAVGAPRAGELIDRFGCVQCHEGVPKRTARAEESCTVCHRAIEAGSYPVAPATLRDWQGKMRHYLDVPTLTGVTHLRRAWLEDFLRNPVDLRPALEDTMPHLPMTAAEARILARHLVPDQPTKPRGGAVGDVAMGSAIFAREGCATCHRFTGATFPAPQPSTKIVDLDPPRLIRALRRAPDLMHTRARYDRTTVETWLRGPGAMKADAVMPDPGLGDLERSHLAAFVMEAPLDEPPAPPVPPTRLPVLSRPVRYAEIETKVLRTSCWHCHMDRDLGFKPGDGGPGNSGGMGYRGAGLSVSSHAAMMLGGRGPKGEKRRLGDDLGGAPRLVRHLLARWDEERGVRDPAVLGMPLGLPPLPAEDIQLVETWVAQGMPR